MPEAFSHREGSLHLWTGSATASALMAYVQNMQSNFVRGWLNEPRGDRSYRNVQTGQRADWQFGTFLTYDMGIVRLFESATAVHAHFKESGVNGSAGWYAYSGRLDNLSVNSQEGALLNLSLAYHTNAWSAYGG